MKRNYCVAASILAARKADVSYHTHKTATWNEGIETMLPNQIQL